MNVLKQSSKMLYLPVIAVWKLEHANIPWLNFTLV